jgi:alkanesulfonate monooxygenase SsuD/methylene tetrahydromethanopterin reductase-like flavin-dependent oxidoreductase (luciferase family)
MIEFGYFLTPSAADYPALVRQARLADDAGIDLVGVQDHPYQRRFLDTWTLLSALAVQTERVRFFPDVANLPLRPPAVLAKAAASLDVISGGRVELGIGAGGFWDAIEAMGGPRRTPGEAVAALEEAIAVIRAMWSQERSARVQGRFYGLAGVHPGPVPAHPIEIWVGAYRPRMLDLIGRLADGWLPSSAYVPPAQLPALNERIDAAAAGAGRDPARIRRLYNVMGTITGGASSGFLDGPAAQWVDELTELAVAYRVDTFVFASTAEPEVQLRLFADEVAPRVRENAPRS